jgi:hypothetical protein
LIATAVNAAGYLVQPGQLEVDARRGDVKELAHALDCDRFRCPHLKEAAQ